jgi:hypothetical protein
VDTRTIAIIALVIAVALVVILFVIWSCARCEQVARSGCMASPVAMSACVRLDHDAARSSAARERGDSGRTVERETMERGRDNQPAGDREREGTPFPTRFGRNKRRYVRRPRLFGRPAGDMTPGEQRTAVADDTGAEAPGVARPTE